MLVCTGGKGERTISNAEVPLPLSPIVRTAENESQQVPPIPCSPWLMKDSANMGRKGRGLFLLAEVGGVAFSAKSVRPVRADSPVEPSAHRGTVPPVD